ncbi:GNAT family N-acetyltransferase [Thalassomonas actiniarum]|uniref:GNAT family N-acetyltransferase n=1 Tax=Thalassomonas actiniarum TaxID=485447 RepID=A0AAE9YU56_9GAMM|nr:GNAT family N-acetyltransferase [Thalassomonas actiniarum]WDE01161.1 GNAT family N-acetyltransferase [Thalassomonas actiniarum]
MAGEILVTTNQQACFSSRHLFFRPLAKQDKALYFSLYTSKQVMRHIGPPLSREQTRQLFTFTLNNTNSDGDQRLSWTVVERQSQKSIGMLALTWDLTRSDAASIGIMLYCDSQGKGYGLEAQGALSEYGFSHLSLNKIYTQFAVTNLVNEHIYHKLGFITSDEKEAEISCNPLPTKSCYLDKQGWQHSFIESCP